MSTVSDELVSGVVDVSSTVRAFAVLKNDGSVVTFGDSRYGGDSTTVSNALASGVLALYSTKKAFAALKGSRVVIWGSNSDGGKIEAANVNALASGAMAVFSTDSAFAVLKNDSSVVSWGHASFGGNSATVSTLLGNVTAVYPTGSAFVALGTNKRAFAWGDSMCGGAMPAVAASTTQSDTMVVLTSRCAVVAVRGDGSVAAWDFANDGPPQTVQNVRNVSSTGRSFAALTSSGAVIAWGDQLYGGNSMTVSYLLTSGVATVYSNPWSFAALKNDGSVVACGYPPGRIHYHGFGRCCVRRYGRRFNGLFLCCAKK